jgi:predicted DsbA family dithiol-disulfide isomerase
VPLAKEIGLDDKPFAQCVDSGKHAARVKEDLEDGAQIGVTGTPANILFHHKSGNVVLKAGAQPLESFKVDIDRMLQDSAAE